LKICAGAGLKYVFLFFNIKKQASTSLYQKNNLPLSHYIYKPLIFIKMKTTKEKIIKVAAKLFFSRGYEAASTYEMAEMTGLSNNSGLFRHFKSKEEIYKAVVEQYITKAQTPQEKFGDCSTLSLREFIDLYVEKVEKTMDYLRNVIQAENKTANRYLSFVLETGNKYEECANSFLLFNQEEIDLWKDIIENAQKSGEVRIDINSLDAAKTFRYAFSGISYIFSIKNGVEISEIRKTLYGIYNLIK
jgi:AcrR family transcriptional regulator